MLILFAGQLIFSLLGITVNDLRVGGGLILLVLSISNLIFGDFRRRDPTAGGEEDAASVGVVPHRHPHDHRPGRHHLDPGVAGGLTATCRRCSRWCVNMVLVFLTLAARPFIGRFMRVRPSPAPSRRWRASSSPPSPWR